MKQAYPSEGDERVLEVVADCNDRGITVSAKQVAYAISMLLDMGTEDPVARIKQEVHTSRGMSELIDTLKKIKDNVQASRKLETMRAEFPDGTLVEADVSCVHFTNERIGKLVRAGAKAHDKSVRVRGEVVCYPGDGSSSTRWCLKLQDGKEVQCRSLTMTRVSEKSVGDD